MKPILPVVFLLLTAFASCQRASNDLPADPSRVGWVIRAPLPQSSYRTGDTVAIAADVNYITQLHGYSLTLTDSATGATLMDKDVHVHDDHFTISESWINTIPSPATLNLKIGIEIDHNGNSADTMLRFYIRS